MTLDVLGDWGTTRLRLWLMERGEIINRADGPGVGALATTPEETLRDLLAPWRQRGPLRVILAGMAGSRNGLFEAPYVSTPVDRSGWARAACSKQLGNLHVTIAAGLRDDHRNDVSDVMRGEETQIFGAMQLDPALRTGTHVLVLPGTHCKWAEVVDGVVIRFQTALTGELFALLRDHSILLKAGSGGSPEDEKVGFTAGLHRSTQLAAGLQGALFEARTAQLLRERSRTWASGFLSGLLIGDEVAGMTRAFAAQRVAIIGAPVLASLYTEALAARNVASTSLDGSECVLAGLKEFSSDLRTGLTGDAP